MKGCREITNGTFVSHDACTILGDIALGSEARVAKTNENPVEEAADIERTKQERCISKTMLPRSPTRRVARRTSPNSMPGTKMKCGGRQSPCGSLLLIGLPMFVF